jgi:hypothetical protein
MPEQVAFEQGLGHRGTVDLDEGAVPALGQVVKAFSGKFLARATLTDNEHGPRDDGELGQVIEGVIQGPGTADDVIARLAHRYYALNSQILPEV